MVFSCCGLVDLRFLCCCCCCCCSLRRGFECAESFWFSTIFPCNAATNMPHFIHFRGVAAITVRGEIAFCAFHRRDGENKATTRIPREIHGIFWLNCVLKCRRRGCTNSAWNRENGPNVCSRFVITFIWCIRTQLESEWRVFGAFCFTNFRFWCAKFALIRRNSLLFLTQKPKHI